MAQYTMTLPEVLTVTKGQLFDPTLPFRDYPNLQRKIIDHFVDREIAFETAELFKYKLNSYLRLRVFNYNKMFDSQLIEIDPFVTDYLVTQGGTKNASKQKQHEGETEHREHTNERETRNTETYNEEHTGSETGKHYQENAGVEVTGKFYSEAENVQKDTSGSRDLTHKETGSLERETDYTKDKTGTENEDYSENKIGNKTTERTGNKTSEGSDNQTGREWTEKGDSQGHNLDVHSDTPQAMLFNQPPHYAVYGTGRAHMHGKVTQDAEGNDVVSDFQETSINAVDTQSMEIGSEDTPWFNYASTADNKTGHDEYSKEGTEKYQRSSTGKENETVNEETDETTNTTGEKAKDYTDHDEGNETVNENTTKDYTDAEKTTGLEENSKSVNSNEHGKSDSKTEESFQEEGTNTHTTDTTKNRIDSDYEHGSLDNNRKLHRGTETKADSKHHEIKKGRTMQSPSKLLNEYRETLLFNADMWLFGELEPLFMQLF